MIIAKGNPEIKNLAVRESCVDIEFEFELRLFFTVQVYRRVKHIVVMQRAILSSSYSLFLTS